jgi:hypothetical protein
MTVQPAPWGGFYVSLLLPSPLFIFLLQYNDFYSDLIRENMQHLSRFYLLCILCIFACTKSVQIRFPFIRKGPIKTLVATSTRPLVPLNRSTSIVPTIQEPSPYPKTKKTNQFLNFIAGGLAGMIASSITIPLEVVKTQLQTSTKTADMTALSICKKIMNQSGPKGFFKGLQPLLIGIIPTRAIYFWSYSATKNALSRTKLKDSSLGHLISACVAGFSSNTVR